MNDGLNPIRDEDLLRDACNTLEAFTFGGVVGGYRVDGIGTLLKELYEASSAYDTAYSEAYKKSTSTSVAGRERDAEMSQPVQEAADRKKRAERRLEKNKNVCTNMRSLIEGYRSLVASSREMAR